MKNSLKFSLIACLSVMMFSCHRQLLEDWYYVKAKIPISVDWKVCNISPQNVSVLFFNESNGSLALQHYYENNSNAIQSYVEVPEGIYTVILFNELPGQVQNVTIDNISDYSKIEADGVKATSVSLPISGEVYYAQPAPFASIVIKHFEVTTDMVYYTNVPSWLSGFTLEEDISDDAKALMGLVPLRDLSLFKATIHVKGLNNARMPALMTLRNVSSTYLFNEEKYGLTPVNYQGNAGNRVYDDNSTTNGTISGQLNIFGVLGGRTSTIDQKASTPILLDLRFQLVDADKTVIAKEFDITNLITFEELSDGTILIQLAIDDPEPLPDVEPEKPETPSGFDTTVEDWEIVEVPIEI